LDTKEDENKKPKVFIWWRDEIKDEERERGHCFLFYHRLTKEENENLILFC